MKKGRRNKSEKGLHNLKISSKAIRKNKQLERPEQESKLMAEDCIGSEDD